MSFEEFLLEVVDRSPFLISETVAPSQPSNDPTNPSNAHPINDKDSNRGDKRSRTSDPTQTMPHKRETMACLQRLLVDGPLHPLGAEHALYHTLLSAFSATLGAAREVWRATQSLHEAEECFGRATSETDGEEAARQRVAALRKALASRQAGLEAQKHQLEAAGRKVRGVLEALVQDGNRPA